MSSLMGMNRYFADEGLKGLGNAANLQTQRENTKTQLEAAHDATVKSTTASMAGSGAMLGYAAAPTLTGMAPATAVPAGMLSGAIPTAGGSTMATVAAPSLLQGGLIADTGLMAGGAATGTSAAVGATAATAGAGTATTGLTTGSALGPLGAVVGLGLGALAGWIFSDY